MLKKSIFILLILILVFSSFAFSSEKADELNTLNILKGYDNDYQLNESLTRAEGLTFIIRLIGKEGFVLDKKDLLSNTGFNDVSQIEWYAPYIGYGKAFSMIQGYGDGSFKPNQNLSEREFYTMLLNALNIDNDWNNVEEQAYENNIILTKDSINDSNYLRENVVNVLYQTLNTRKDLIDNLVDSSVVSQETVNDLKLYKTDELSTDIKQINVKSKNEFEITFNEDVTELNLSIEELNVTNYELTKNSATVTHEASKEGQEYTVLISSVTDSDGFMTRNLSSTFKGFKDEPIESNYFLISDIEAVSKSQINVYFTQEVTMGAALPLYYDIYQDGEIYVEGSFDSMKVAKMGAVDNGITIWLNDEFLFNNAEYTLSVSDDVMSKYGVNHKDNSEMSFIGNGDENNTLGIESMRVLNDKYIRVIFTEDVSNSATNITNYSLLNKTNDITYNNAFQVRFTGIDELKYRQVDIKYTNLDPDKDYELTIKDIEDKFKARSINEIVLPFSEYVPVDDLKIDAAVAKNNGVVLLYFNKVLSSDNIFNNILISNPAITIDSKLYDQNEPYLLSLILDKNDLLTNEEEYDVQILQNSIEDINGEDNDEILIANLSGTDNPYPELRFSEARFVSDDYVYVRFNNNISESNASSKFRLEYKDEDDDSQYINSTGITYLNTFEAIIKFSNLDTSESFKIEGNNIDDYSNQYQSNKFSRSVERE